MEQLAKSNLGADIRLRRHFNIRLGPQAGDQLGTDRTGRIVRSPVDCLDDRVRSVEPFKGNLYEIVTRLGIRLILAFPCELLERVSDGLRERDSRGAVRISVRVCKRLADVNKGKSSGKLSIPIRRLESHHQFDDVTMLLHSLMIHTRLAAESESLLAGMGDALDYLGRGTMTGTAVGLGHLPAHIVVVGFLGHAGVRMDQFGANGRGKVYFLWLVGRDWNGCRCEYRRTHTTSVGISLE